MAEAAKKLNNDLMAALNKTKVDKKPTKKSKSMPALDNVPENVKEAVDNVVMGKKKKKEAEARIKANEPTVIDYVKDIQDDAGYDGDFRNSYEVPGNDSSVKYVSSNRASINSDDIAEIKELVGEDAYNELFDEKYNTFFKDSFFKDEELQKKVVELLGPLFSELFETVMTVSLKDDFDKNIYKYVDKDKLEMLRVFVKMYKPALR